MTRPRINRYPVSSFGPELLTALTKGAIGRVEIKCKDQRTMRHLQLRLQTLRGSMGREKHPQYQLVTRARTSRTWDPEDHDKDCVLVIQPNDAQYTDMMREAGITTDELQHGKDILDNLTNTPSIINEDDLSPPERDPYAKFKGG